MIYQYEKAWRYWAISLFSQRYKVMRAMLRKIHQSLIRVNGRDPCINSHLLSRISLCCVCDARVLLLNGRVFLQYIYRSWSLLLA